jgi:hypothetical protein
MGWRQAPLIDSVTCRVRGAREGRTRVVPVLFLALVLPGCASVTCQPASIVVAKKEERVRPEPSLGLRTTETGRIEEGPLTLIREYWVQAEGGTWYRVSAGQFKVAEANEALEICR